MANNNSRFSWLFKNIAALTSIFIIVIILLSMGIVYYWSFVYFDNIFEDRIIDEYTLKDNEDLGVKNEWILGVTTDSIDVLEAVHTEDVSGHIKEKSLDQENINKLYKEKIGDKNLIYMINLDTENGEHIYKYSVIKDIYKEVFPKIALSFLFLAFLLFLITYIYATSLSNKLYNNLRKLIVHTRNLTYRQDTVPVNINSQDKMIEELGDEFNKMQNTIIEKDELQQTTLQYISHEMKTPIMIIKSYADSAKDGIYPKENLAGTLDTIIAQTKRMEEKIRSLMTVVRINSSDFNNEECINIPIYPLIEKININLSQLAKDKEFFFYGDKDASIYGNPNRILTLFENLIENQIRYSKTFYTIRLFEREDYINILFYNNGEKIEDRIKDNIFKPFIKGSKGKNGLGLSICKTIAKQHNGSIKLLNSKKGVLFRVRLKKSGLFNEN